MDGSGGDDMINAAVAIAQRADVVILATGERTYAEAPVRRKRKRNQIKADTRTHGCACECNVLCMHSTSYIMS